MTSKLVNLFSSGRTTPRSKRSSPTSSQEEVVDEDSEHERLLTRSPRILKRTKTSNTNEADYNAIKEAALYNAKLNKKVSDSLQKKEKKKDKKSSSSSGVTKKDLLEMEVSLLSRLSEQNDTLVAQKRLIVLLEARIENQEERLAQLENNNNKSESCLGVEEWFSSLFQ